jgi:hypothetical protein
MGMIQGQPLYTPSGQLAGCVGFEDIQQAVSNLERYIQMLKIPECSLWNTQSFSRFSQSIQQNPPKNILLNTLPNTPDDQKCLIPHTINPAFEEEFINWLLQHKLQTKICIFIYGVNACDAKTEQKKTELSKLGFTVFHYRGGLFEWLLLQDIYGNGNSIDRERADASEIEFPTTGNELDILKYRPRTLFPKMITY